MKAKKPSFMERLKSMFGVEKLRKDAKSLKGQLRVRRDMDENGLSGYIMSFNKPKLVNSVFIDGKYKYRVVTNTNEDSEQFLERTRRR